MSSPSVVLKSFPDSYVVARLRPDAAVPTELLSTEVRDGFLSFTRTPEELSIVCPDALAPASAELDGPWRALHIAGPIPFDLTGVVASLVSPLATAGVPVFVVSTFDGDVLMVPSAEAGRSREILTAAGHTVLPSRSAPEADAEAGRVGEGAT